MTRFTLMQKSWAPFTLKILVCIWMFLAVFVFLLLFGPPEFWSICQRMGVGYIFQHWEAWLQPYFTAGYQA
jgi:hypothetical protein